MFKTQKLRSILAGEGLLKKAGLTSFQLGNAGYTHAYELLKELRYGLGHAHSQDHPKIAKFLDDMPSPVEFSEVVTSAWNVLNPSSKRAGVSKPPEDPLALVALNTLMKKLNLPLFKNLNQKEVAIDVPTGFDSLFDAIAIEVGWARGSGAPDESPSWGRVGWVYEHPKGQGSNGLNVGSVFFDSKFGRWAWQIDSTREMGYVP